MKKETWIVVANSSFAKIYKAENNNKLIEIRELQHPESRLHDQDLVSSTPGRTFSSVGTRRSMLEPTTTPKEQEMNLFAKEISHCLEHHKETLGRIYIFASPSFLGLLRQHFSSAIDTLIAGQVDRDLTHSTTEEIRAHLPHVL